MTTKASILKRILDEKVVAIVRLPEQSLIPDCIECLVKGGIKCLEITSNTPGYLEEITNTITKFPGVLVGAGTITNQHKALEAINAGAKFLVTPNVDLEVIKRAHEAQIPVLMGALTPTEINLAAESGADIIKLFPAGELGMNYYKSIKGPFDSLPIFVVGGVNKDNALDWLKAGVAGIGVGNQLCRSVRDEADKAAHIEYVKDFNERLKDYLHG